VQKHLKKTFKEMYSNVKKADLEKARRAVWAPEAEKRKEERNKRAKSVEENIRVDPNAEESPVKKKKRVTPSPSEASFFEIHYFAAREYHAAANVKFALSHARHLLNEDITKLRQVRSELKDGSYDFDAYNMAKTLDWVQLPEEYVPRPKPTVAYVPRKRKPVNPKPRELTDVNVAKLRIPVQLKEPSREWINDFIAGQLSEEWREMIIKLLTNQRKRAWRYEAFCRAHPLAKKLGIDIPDSAPWDGNVGVDYIKFATLDDCTEKEIPLEFQNIAKERCTFNRLP